MKLEGSSGRPWPNSAGMRKMVAQLVVPGSFQSFQWNMFLFARLQRKMHAVRGRADQTLDQLRDRFGVMMRKLSWNWPAWVGFLSSILAFVSYFTVLVRFPITRDVPWVNFLLFGVAALFFLTGLNRAFTGSGSLGGKLVSSVLALLGVSILAVFCFIVFHATRQLPASHGAPIVGQKAPDFALRDTGGKLVSLSTLLSSPPELASSGTAPEGVLLIFYRGYW